MKSPWFKQTTGYLNWSFSKSLSTFPHNFIRFRELGNLFNNHELWVFLSRQPGSTRRYLHSVVIFSRPQSTSKLRLNFQLIIPDEYSMSRAVMWTSNGSCQVFFLQYAFKSEECFSSQLFRSIQIYIIRCVLHVCNSNVFFWIRFINSSNVQVWENKNQKPKAPKLCVVFYLLGQ